MDSKPETPPSANDAAPKPAPAPVMDVVAPPPPAPDPQPAGNNDDKPHDPPPADPPGGGGKPGDKPKGGKSKLELPPTPAKPVAPKQHSGVGLAIFATIVIVFGLAALAVYAYLKSR